MTEHRHQDSRKQWTTSVKDPDLTPYATDADVARLEARIKALEDAAQSTPPPAGVTLTVPPGAPASTLISMLQQNCDRINLAGPFYPWEKVQIDVDRTTQPVMIGRAPGVPQVAFPGWGKTSEGVFFFGLNGVTKHISMDGLGPFSPVLAQAGVFEVRSGDYISLTNMILNHRRDPLWADSAPFKSHAAYISMGSGVRSIDHLTIDGWKLLRPTIRRDVSAFTIGSSTLHNGSIHITNVWMDGYCFALWADVDTDDLLIDSWSVNDSGIVIPTHTEASLSFQAKAIKGIYRNVHAVGSSPIVNLSTGPMVDGGGNFFA